jgi:hypothetical protein
MPCNWERIETLRQAVSLCAAAAFEDPDLEERVAMVSAELLENAVKHGRPEPIRYSLRDDRDSIIVSVRNAIDSTTPSIETLVSRLKWLSSFPDPRDAYLSAMSVIYEDGARAGGSELGLVRIAFEGRCQVECDTSEPGWVTVRATYPLPAEPGDTP